MLNNAPFMKKLDVLTKEISWGFNKTEFYNSTLLHFSRSYV